MPRLFAYGGTRFSERQRLGVWALSSVEPFNDSTGVPESGFAIGILWDSGGAALLLRQQQKDFTGRSTVFTLLLDPGFMVWERVSWNAAVLALALFGEDGKAGSGNILLLRPEEVTAEELVTLLAKVEKTSIRREDNPRFASVWVGAMAEQDLVVVPFAEAGWETAPTANSLAGRLASLPLCFRAGTSWLVGGNRPQARSLNIRLVLNRFEPDPLPLALAEHGAHLLEGWKIAVGASTELKTFDAQPLALWEGAPEIVFERAEMLAAFCSQRPEAEATLPSLLKALQSPGPAAADIRQAALRFAISGKGRMSAARTRFALELSEEIEPTRPHALADRLDQQATIAHYTAEPAPSLPAKFQLPVEWRLHIWRERLTHKKSVTAVTPVLEAALRDLPPEGHLKVIRHTISELLSRSSLYEWLPFFEEHPEWRRKAADFLQERARTDVAKATAESTLSYLIFGNDPGGRFLAERGINRQDIVSLVNWINAEAVSDEYACAKLARAWLEAMAESPFRGSATLKQKLAAARDLARASTGGRAWQWLRKLDQLYLGQKVSFVPGKVTAEERDFLREEFREMLAQPPGHDLPQLAEIKRLLDGIPGKLMVPLSELGVPEHLAEPWVERLRESGLSDAAEKLLARVAMRAKKGETRRRAFTQAEGAALTDELTRLLRDLCESRSRTSEERFGDFLKCVQGDDRLREKVAAVIRGAWRQACDGGERSRERILRCLAMDPALFVEFATGFDVSVQQNLLRNLERFSPQRMRVDSIRAARDLDHGKPLDRRTKALLRYMHSRAGEQLRRVAGSDAYEGGVKAFDRHLCRIFGLERAAQAEEDRFGFLGRMLGFFQHRRAK